MPTALAPPSRRERKKQATRDAIAIAALELAEERGMAALTVDAIAARADVAPRTFFNYFPSKEAAVVGSGPDRAENLAKALLERPADEAPLAALRHVLTDDLVDRMVSAEVLQRRIRVVREDPELRAAMAGQFDALGRRLAHAMAERLERPADDPYPSLVATVALGASKVALMQWCDQGGRTSLIKGIDTAFNHIANGLTGDPAPRRGHRALSPRSSRV